MPKGKSYRRRHRRKYNPNRKYKVARYRGNLHTSVQRMPGVAEKQIVKLKYSEQVGISFSSPGVASEYLFRANSIFDPNFTGIGHQPMGHDQWEPFYNHYTVIGSRCKATFFSDPTSDPTTADMHLVGIYLADNAGAIPIPTSLIEQGKSRVRYLSASQGSRAITSMTSNFSAKKNLGLQSIRDNRSLVGANFGSNPVEQTFFHVYASGADPAAIPDGLNVLVEIEYICYLSEPKTLGQS